MLPVTEFHKDRSKKDGLHCYCKTCNKAKARAHQVANQETRAVYAAEWQRINAERSREAGRKYREAHPERIAAKRQREKESGAVRRMRLRREYDLTAEQYAAMVEAQGGLCAICLEPPTRSYGLDVDHCHATGGVRGLLCWNCNTTLGKFRDDPVRFRRAADYLSRA